MTRAGLTLGENTIIGVTDWNIHVARKEYLYPFSAGHAGVIIQAASALATLNGKKGRYCSKERTLNAPKIVVARRYPDTGHEGSRHIPVKKISTFRTRSFLSPATNAHPTSLQPQTVAAMDKFQGPHPDAPGKPPGFAGYPISPLPSKRRSSSNTSSSALTAAGMLAEERLEAKGGGIGNDSDNRYLPRLRRSDGRGDSQLGTG